MTNKTENKKLLSHLRQTKKLLKDIFNDENLKKNTNHNLKIIIYGIERLIHQFLKIDNLEEMLINEKEITKCITNAISLIYFYFLENNFIDKNELLKKDFIIEKLEKAKEKITKINQIINLKDEEILKLNSKLRENEKKYKSDLKINEEFEKLKEEKRLWDDKLQKTKVLLKKSRIKQKTLKFENDEFKKQFRFLKDENNKINKIGNKKTISNNSEKKIQEKNKQTVRLKMEKTRKTEKANTRIENDNKK
ncbi:hypothetical protein [Candidatus Hepatoplasma crinochetorum]|uniref:hypothetical protein n=1 Tax=Candidatus Hepatoplasma crinochetorum TaxID=295596 RepID=UPI00308C379A|nr:MAG: hypothetical protein HCTKY_2860 [Candidatus Hepatoplasma crinochetorum]